MLLPSCPAVSMRISIPWAVHHGPLTIGYGDRNCTLLVPEYEKLSRSQSEEDERPVCVRHKGTKAASYEAMPTGLAFDAIGGGIAGGLCACS